MPVNYRNVADSKNLGGIYTGTGGLDSVTQAEIDNPFKDAHDIGNASRKSLEDVERMFNQNLKKNGQMKGLYGEGKQSVLSVIERDSMVQGDPHNNISSNNNISNNNKSPTYFTKWWLM